MDQGPFLESDIEESSATFTSVETSVQGVLSELQTRMYQVTKEVSVSPSTDDKNTQKSMWNYSIKDFSGETKVETRNSLLLKEIGGRVISEPRGHESQVESMQLSPREARSKEASPQEDPSKEFSKSKGGLGVTQEELDILKKELFVYIEQWKVDIISAINQKRERQRCGGVHLVH